MRYDTYSFPSQRLGFRWASAEKVWRAVVGHRNTWESDLAALEKACKDAGCDFEVSVIYFTIIFLAT